MIRKIVLFLSIVIASGVLVTNIYTSVVDAKSWGSNIPASIETARHYFAAVNPGTFFRVSSPLNQAMALLALVLFWKSAPGVRVYLGLALPSYVITDAFTFGYFYPRNAIMFESSADIATLKRAWSDWNTMNWLRSLLMLAGVFFSCLSLHKVYTKDS